jgi:hypothetical protein
MGEADIIRWKEAVWGKRGLRQGRAVRIGDRAGDGGSHRGGHGERVCDAARARGPRFGGQDRQGDPPTR